MDAQTSISSAVSEVAFSVVFLAGSAPGVTILGCFWKKAAAATSSFSNHLSVSSRWAGMTTDRKSVESGKSVSVRVDLGGRRLIKQTKLLLDCYHLSRNTHHLIKR